MRKNYLVIIDESDELKNAIYFAAKRSVVNNANLIMLYVVRPAVNTEWASVGNLIEQEETSEGKKIAWVGDGNNVTNSLMEAATQFDFELKIACPKDYMPSKKVIDWAKKKKADIEIVHDAKEAADNADCIMTDKWISMGDKGNLSKKRKAFKNFQVNEKLMKIAKKDAIFMHDLPAQRGEEVSAGVIDGKQSDRKSTRLTGVQCFFYIQSLYFSSLGPCLMCDKNFSK